MRYLFMGLAGNYRCKGLFDISQLLRKRARERFGQIGTAELHNSVLGSHPQLALKKLRFGIWFVIRNLK
jgi:hypothetical protein